MRSATAARRGRQRGDGLGAGDGHFSRGTSQFRRAGQRRRGDVHAGAVPVIADVDALTRTLDADAVRAAITSRTKAVIAVHMYGQRADMTARNAIAGQHGLAVIEDCAQAAGAAHHGRAAGTLGDIGSFSMWAGKNLGGLSDVGLLIARGPEHGSGTTPTHGRSGSASHWMH